MTLFQVLFAAVIMGTCVLFGFALCIFAILQTIHGWIMAPVDDSADD